jgi:hypothetical protein
MSLQFPRWNEVSLSGLKWRQRSHSMSMPDPWERAAQCAHAAQASSDPDHRAIFKRLHGMWVTLAHKRHLVTAEEWTRKIAAISRLQASLPARLTDGYPIKFEVVP